jgi:hypothetical protein
LNDPVNIIALALACSVALLARSESTGGVSTLARARFGKGSLAKVLSLRPR